MQRNLPNSAAEPWWSKSGRFARSLLTLAALAIALATGCNSLSDTSLDGRIEGDATDADGRSSDADRDTIQLDADVDDAFNSCGGREPLRWEGEAATLGGSCGPCDDGVLVCNGPDAVRCARSSRPNVCGGCGELADAPGGLCGPCGTGVLQCDGDGKLVCEGAVGRNLCGGCEPLENPAGSPCVDGDGHAGRWACDGANAVVCRAGAVNACGGDGEVLLYEGEPSNVGDGCGPCADGALVCAGASTLECAGASAPNECGGCGALPAAPGDACGACDGRWACTEDGRLACDNRAPNACGGCGELPFAPGTTCGGGVRICASVGAVVCLSPAAELNACGGETELGADPGNPCGTCNRGTWACDGTEAVVCTDDPGPGGASACGGCATLSAPPETSCGACASGTWTCDGDEAVACEGDAGDSARNACGGCHPLIAAPGDACGPCKIFACDEGRLICVVDVDEPGCAESPTTCGELGCAERSRVCEPADDERDARCGACIEGFEEVEGRCEETESCPESEDGVDTDGDGIPDACDRCPLDNPDDTDGDAVCDSDDVCPDGDDRLDSDEDGVPDACDDCVGDGADDRDEDGACDDADACPDEPAFSATTNVCGGCAVLSPEPGAECGDCGTARCDGEDAVQCDDPGFNACGGCSELSGEPGESCFECGEWACVGTESVGCRREAGEIHRIDAWEPGEEAAIQGGMRAGEAAAVCFHVDDPDAHLEVTAVDYFFAGTDSTERFDVTITVYDRGGAGNPPASPAGTSTVSATPIDRRLNRATFDVDPPNVTGDFCVGIGLERAAPPSVARDADGTIDADDNWLYDPTVGWRLAASLGLTGDFIIRAEARPGCEGSGDDGTEF